MNILSALFGINTLLFIYNFQFYFWFLSNLHCVFFQKSWKVLNVFCIFVFYYLFFGVFFSPIDDIPLMNSRAKCIYCNSYLLGQPGIILMCLSIPFLIILRSITSTGVVFWPSTQPKMPFKEESDTFQWQLGEEIAWAEIG